MSVNIINTPDGYMAQIESGKYLMDKDGNNLFDTREEAEAIRKVYILEFVLWSAMEYIVDLLGSDADESPMLRWLNEKLAEVQS